MPPIALLSDLGEKDYFIGAMKGTILSIDPDANIVDISHQIPKHDVRTAAFVLANAAKTFPKGSIFVVVVDPGVGTKRRCLLLRTKNDMTFIGPNNGVFTLVADNFGVQEIREISNEELMMSEISATFHGRDVMAPIAAKLSEGLDPSKVGPRVGGLKRLKIEGSKVEDGDIHGQIIHVDDFGNLVTNIESDLMDQFAELGAELEIEIGKRKIEAKFVRTFGEVAVGEKLCYIGSADLLEAAKNSESLAEELGAGLGDEVVLKPLT